MPENYHERAPSGSRLILSEAVPLPKPQCIRIEPAQICNFRCEYCLLSLENYRKNATGGLIDYDLFLSVVKDIQKSFGHVKTIMLVGMGESLLHPRIADMVVAITDYKLADTVEITTNAALLKPELSDALVSAGLSMIRLSVNGLSDSDFKTYSGVQVDFEEYVRNIAYLYAHKKQLKIYAKILNYMVKDPRRYEKFIQTFEPICDMISVENLIEGTSEIDYQKIAGDGITFDQTQSNTSLVQTKICSMPFYTLQVNVDGTVYPCCASGAPCIGNIQHASLKEIWEHAAFEFQRRMLDGVSGMKYCELCASMKYRVYPEDALDKQADMLKVRYDEIVR